MLRQPFSARPAYVQSIRGLLRLHVLTEADQDETPEADAIRDCLERPWYDLSQAEKQRIAGLSEDLYTISGPSGQPFPTNPQAQRKLWEAIDARDTGNWDKALELLRYLGKHLDPAVLSFLRGSVWEKAGDSETATTFFGLTSADECASAPWSFLRPMKYGQTSMSGWRFRWQN